MATKLLISDNSAYLINASATNDSYEYYHKNNNYADTLEELEEKLAEQLDNNNIATVRCNENITEEDIQEKTIHFQVRLYHRALSFLCLYM